MKYEVSYLKPKQRGYAKQSAVFFKLDDAFAWQSYVKSVGAKEIIVTPK